MKLKKTALLSASAAALLACTMTASGADGNTVNITIDTSKDRKAISPYIYGVNAELMERDVPCKSVRAGGNRYSAYNWETNASNAGADWKNISDGYFQQAVPADMQDTPGCAALHLSEVCKQKNAYPLMTLEMAGYVAADMNGEVSAAEKAPSDRWDKVELVKGAEFTLQPDLGDKTVYMDEFVNYLVETLGDSQNGGIRGYSLDNEPSLWKGTHALVHPEQTTCQEILDKSVTMAKAVKDIDPDAEIFGPALFGYGAFTNFAGAPDWNEMKSWNADYRWFIDWYLDEMKKAEEENGKRLLDVLDIHYYTEAKGVCGERSCSHFTDEGCVGARLNSTRSLWDDSYTEDSWITDTGAEFLPLLPNIRQSIDRFYPGTKLAITEYDFGAPYDISGGIAEADALGVYAQNEVYFASLFTFDADYQMAAINLYTDYDGQGSGFGDTLVSCDSDNIELSTAYAAVNGDSDDVVTLCITNKSFREKTTANIKLNGEYGYAHLYGLSSMAAQVFDMGDSENGAVTLSGDTLTYEMEPETVSMIVIGRDKNALEPQSDAVTEKKDTGSGDKHSSKTARNAAAAGGAGTVIIIAAAAVMRKKKGTKAEK